MNAFSQIALWSDSQVQTLVRLTVSSFVNAHPYVVRSDSGYCTTETHTASAHSGKLGPMRNWTAKWRGSIPNDGQRYALTV